MPFNAPFLVGQASCACNRQPTVLIQRCFFGEDPTFINRRKAAELPGGGRMSHCYISKPRRTECPLRRLPLQERECTTGSSE